MLYTSEFRLTGPVSATDLLSTIRMMSLTASRSYSFTIILPPLRAVAFQLTFLIGSPGMYSRRL